MSRRPAGRAPEPEPAGAHRARGVGGAIAAGLVVLAAGAAARLAAWRQVLGSDGVRFLFDGDPLYHLRQAERGLADGFGAIAFDPWLSWPQGAQVLWPPLWDAVIGGTARLLHGPRPTVEQLERVAAFLPVAIGLLLLPMVAFLARRLLPPGRATWAALLAALLGASWSLSTIGRPDQHALEVLLASGVVAGFATAALAPSRSGLARGSVAMALATALAFWNWQGSALALLPPAVATALAHVFLRRQDAARLARALTLGAGGGALLLLGSVAAWGPPGSLSRGTLPGISALHVVIAASVAAFGGALLLANRLAPAAGTAVRAAGSLAAGTVIAAVALGASPSIRAGVLHGLSALSASGDWYSFIGEYQAPFLGCQVPFSSELRTFLENWGLSFLAAALAVPAMVARWRGDRHRPETLLLAAWAGVFLPLALLRVRFNAYLLVPLALVAADGIVAAARWLSARARGRVGVTSLGAVLTILVVAPSVEVLRRPLLPDDEDAAASARWLARVPWSPGREGVLAPWPAGHAFLHYARRPVVVSPFGADVGPEPMAFSAAVLLSTDPAAAEDALLRRRVGHLVVGDPWVNLPLDQRLAPGRPRLAEVRCDLLRGPEVHVDRAALATTGSRLFLLDGGVAEGGAVPFTRLRLVHESPALASPEPPRTSLKTFEVVPGAIVRVSGAAPGSMVRAVARVRTDSGRRFDWGAAAGAGPDGVAVLRVPYAAGANGGSTVELTVGDGVKGMPAPVTDADVVEGRRVDVRLAPP